MSKLVANVSATPSFAANLKEIRAFFERQDPESAKDRMNALRTEISAARMRLTQFPASGRPTRCLTPLTVDGQLLADEVTKFANQQNLTLREFFLKRHVILYAHDNHRVFLIYLKHTSQGEYVI